MRIAHFAPYAPSRAGIYESARDMVVADLLAGHSTHLVDVGITANGQREEPKVGVTDERGVVPITTASPSVADEADVLVMHTGVPDAWVVRSQAPIVWIVHGRPLASFRPEQNGGLSSYSVYCEVAKWPRTKAMVYFWPEFTPYWRVVFPKEKLIELPYPPIDGQRFAPVGQTHSIAPCNRGRFNGLICDSWREDVDIFEVVNGAIEAAKRIQGLTWHLCAMESPLRPCWEYLMVALRQLGALGEVCGRMTDMEERYRAFDFLLTPHRIVTRCIGEALTCAMPVVAANGCTVTRYTADVSDPLSVAAVVEGVVARLDKDRDGMQAEALEMAGRFDLVAHGSRMSGIYRDAA